MIKAAAICIGVGLLFNYSSHSKKMKAEVLGRATHLNELKGLEEFLEKKPLFRTVVVHGTVRSTSPVGNNRGGTLGVFVEETASLRFKRMNIIGSALESMSKVVNRKEVPWYLDDGTAGVYVSDYQDAEGFFDILQSYYFTEPVAKHFESLVSMKEIKVPDGNRCECCEQILEIGTRLTVVGRAEKDKDGFPTIGQAYQVFNEHLELDKLVNNFESNSVWCGKLSLFITAMGVVLLAGSVLQNVLDIKE